MHFFLLFLFTKLTIASINLSSFTNFPNYTTLSNKLLTIGLNDSPYEIFISLNEPGFPIVRMDVTRASDIYEMGRYIWDGTQNSGFTSMYFVGDFLIASSSESQSPKIFKISTFESVGTFNYNCNITSAVHLVQWNRFVFGTSRANVMYTSTSNLPTVNLLPIKVQNLPYSTFLTKSNNQVYISVSYQEVGNLSFYNTNIFAEIKNFIIGASGVYTSTWTKNSQYVVVFPYNMSYILVYDSTNNFSLFSNHTFLENMRDCFSYPDTDSLLCVSPINSSIIVARWPSLTPSVLISRDIGRIGSISSDKKLMTHYDPEVGKGYFYNISKPCGIGYYLDSGGFCAQCTSNCQRCENASYCTICSSGCPPTNNNTMCLTQFICFPTCNNGYFFDQLLYACVKCRPNCLQCVSETACSTCESEFILINETCRYCPINTIYNSTSQTCVSIVPFCSGDKFYDVSSALCVQCQVNCFQCNSITKCKTCLTNFTVFNGTCQSCSSGTFYNSTTLLCDNCSLQCLQCTSLSTCSSCAVNSTLISGVCAPCSNSTFYNTSTKLCDDIAGFCTGDQYFNVSLTHCVQCQVNCVQCSSTKTCKICLANFTVVNGTCQPCARGTFYNSTNFLCDSCLPHCTQCTQSNTCIKCALNYNLVNSPDFSCIICSFGSFFNPSTQICQSTCVDNCVTCLSYDSCGACANGYTLNANKTCLKIIDLLDGDTNDNLDSQEVFLGLMSLTLENNLIQGANKIPGSRILIYQIFGFFINIDHLWLYIYHKRQYSTFISNFFGAIRKMEDQKWNSVSEEFLNSRLTINFTQVGQRLNFKVNQTSWKFLQIEGQSRSFLLNNLQYFCMNVPFVVLIFMTLKMLFNLLFHYKISILFRSYSFKLFLIIMLMEGNIESFTYFLIYDCVELTNSQFFEKGINALTIIMFMTFMAYIFVGYALIKQTKDKKLRYFFNNYEINIQGLIHISLQKSIFDFLLGITHFLMQNDYKSQLKLLFLIQFGYLVLQIRGIRSKLVYRLKYIEWQNIFASVIRICLISSFSLDQNMSEEKRKSFDQIQLLIMILYLTNWVLSIAINLILIFMGFLKEIINGVCNKGNKIKQKSSKNEFENNNFRKKQKLVDWKSSCMIRKRGLQFQKYKDSRNESKHTTDHCSQKMQDKYEKKIKTLSIKKNTAKARIYSVEETSQQCQSIIQSKEQRKKHESKQAIPIIATYKKKIFTKDIKEKFYYTNSPLKPSYLPNQLAKQRTIDLQNQTLNSQPIEFKKNSQFNGIYHLARIKNLFTPSQKQKSVKFKVSKEKPLENNQTAKHFPLNSPQEPPKLRLRQQMELSEYYKKNKIQRDKKMKSEATILERSLTEKQMKNRFITMRHRN